MILCTGKVYYDLLNKQQEEKRKDVAIIRLEQIYPLAENQLAALAKKYAKAEWKWVQEEPKNMGAWTHLLRYDLPFDIKVISRRSSSSPSTGYANVHLEEQAKLIEMAFDLG